VNPLIDQYDVARDGQRFILCVLGDSAAPITVLVNCAAGINPSAGATRAPHQSTQLVLVKTLEASTRKRPLA
jgi:hypothetical protein